MAAAMQNIYLPWYCYVWNPISEIEIWLEYRFCMTLPTFAMIHFFVLVRSSCTVGKIVCKIITRNQLGIVTYHVSPRNYVFHLYAYHVFLILRLAFKNYRPWKSLHLMDRIWKFFYRTQRKVNINSYVSKGLQKQLIFNIIPLIFCRLSFIIVRGIYCWKFETIWIKIGII